MNNKEILKETAVKVNALLTEYVEVHDKILKDAASFSSLFKHVNFKELYDDTITIHSKFYYKKEVISNMKDTMYDYLTRIEKEFFNCLSDYVDALIKTTEILSAQMKLLYDRSENKIKLSYKEYITVNKQYQESVGEYLKIGGRLNDLYSKLYNSGE